MANGMEISFVMEFRNLESTHNFNFFSSRRWIMGLSRTVLNSSSIFFSLNFATCINHSSRAFTYFLQCIGIFQTRWGLKRVTSFRLMWNFCSVQPTSYLYLELTSVSLMRIWQRDVSSLSVRPEYLKPKKERKDTSSCEKWWWRFWGNVNLLCIGNSSLQYGRHGLLKSSWKSVSKFKEVNVFLLASWQLSEFLSIIRLSAIEFQKSFQHQEIDNF